MERSQPKNGLNNMKYYVYFLKKAKPEEDHMLVLQQITAEDLSSIIMGKINRLNHIDHGH